MNGDILYIWDDGMAFSMNEQFCSLEYYSTFSFFLRMFSTKYHCILKHWSGVVVGLLPWLLVNACPFSCRDRPQKVFLST